MEKEVYKKISTNAIMLYLLTFSKIVFPLITLPYLTRVLSVDAYGTVAYVKSIITYVQLTIDFGFIYSAVKDISVLGDKKTEIEKVVGDTILAKLLLAVAAFAVVVLLSFTIPVLKDHKLFVLLSFLSPFFSSFFLDFLYRGIEKMHIVSLIYFSMKSISTVLTLLFITDDSRLLLVPVFDAVGSLVAVVITWIWAYKLGFRMKLTGFKKAIEKIKNSFFYFTNSIASTAFGALNTVIIGAYIFDLEQVAFWSVCVQLIGAVQALYAPISNGIYPHMVKNRDLGLIKKILLIFVPVIILGTLLCYFLAPWILTIISGEKYVAAANIFRILLPVLIFSFPVAILGLPTLGAVGRMKYVNLATFSGAIMQVVGLLLLAVFQVFNIINVAILRNISEFVMFAILLLCVIKHKDDFQTGV